MKNYVKPKIIKNDFYKINLASLNDWLANSGTDYKDAGITTYIIES